MPLRTCGLPPLPRAGCTPAERCGGWVCTLVSACRAVRRTPAERSTVQATCMRRMRWARYRWVHRGAAGDCPAALQITDMEERLHVGLPDFYCTNAAQHARSYVAAIASQAGSLTQRALLSSNCAHAASALRSPNCADAADHRFAFPHHRRQEAQEDGGTGGRGDCRCATRP